MLKTFRSFKLSNKSCKQKLLQPSIIKDYTFLFIPVSVDVTPCCGVEKYALLLLCLPWSYLRPPHFSLIIAYKTYLFALKYFLDQDVEDSMKRQTFLFKFLTRNGCTDKKF